MMRVLAITLFLVFFQYQEPEIVCRNWDDGINQVNCDKCRDCNGNVDHTKCSARCRRDNCKCRSNCETHHH